MGSLNNVRRQAIKPGKIVKLTMNQLVGNPVLMVEHLGETNFGFVNDSLKGAGARASRSTPANPTPESLRRIRDENRETVAKHAVRQLGDGWFWDDEQGNPDPSKPLESNEQGIAAVVDSLPDEVFDSLLAFVSNAENFREVPVETPASTLAKK